MSKEYIKQYESPKKRNNIKITKSMMMEKGSKVVDKFKAAKCGSKMKKHQ